MNEPDNPLLCDANGVPFARLDLGRKQRQGLAEVIWGQDKTVEQLTQIVSAMLAAAASDILITRLTAEKASSLGPRLTCPFVYHAAAGLAVCAPQTELQRGKRGHIAVVAAGTSDLRVAEEAALTCEVLGNKVSRIYDVGVAGLERLLSQVPLLRQARVLIVVAGMEGALPSVVGGLVASPLIAVPSSVGYGASFAGLAALLAMLNSCASGLTVVNIDNGFGAAVAASRINQLGAEQTESEEH